jgi:LuxR family maltose regulon positive regulatory protein
MLEHANLFIVPLDEERNRYRYHHLFADLLRQRLHQNPPPLSSPSVGGTEGRIVAELHRRASAWYKNHGFADQAIEHALRGEDFERAAHLLEEYADALLQRGEHTTVSDWINALPDSLVRERPYLCVYHAWTLQLTGQFEATEARLSDAEEALANLYQENDADAETIRGHIHSHRAYLTFIRGEHAKTIIYSRQALEQLPPEATVIRAQTTLYLGVAYRFQGELQAALDIFAETVAISQKMGGSVTAVLSFLNLAELYTEQAHLHQARNIYEQALQFTKRHTCRPDMPFTGYAYVGIGRILRQWNELDTAYRYTTRGIALCRDRNVAELLALSCIELAHIQHALGNDGQAHEALQEAKQTFIGFSPGGSDMVTAHQAHIDLMRGEIESAERWAQANDLNIDDELELRREVEFLTLARVFIAQNRFEQALSLLARLHQNAQAIGKMQSVLETLMLQAMALSAQGHTEQALIKLEQALAIGEPENYVRIFVDEGLPMARLLY